MKGLKKIVIAILLLLVLCGCEMVMDIGTHIKKSGSGTITLTVAFDQEMLEGLKQMDTMNGIDDLLEPIDFNGKQYYGQSQGINFNSIKQLKEWMTTFGALKSAFPELIESSEAMFSEFNASNNYVEGYVNEMFIRDLGSDAMAYNFGLREYLTYSFDGRITETNGQLLQDGHSVMFDLSKDSYIYAKASSISSVTVVALVLAIVALVLIIVTVKKNKKKQSESKKVVKYCPRCNTKLIDDAKYCPGCGLEINEQESEHTSFNDEEDKLNN